MGGVRGNGGLCQLDPVAVQPSEVGSCKGQGRGVVVEEACYSTTAQHFHFCCLEKSPHSCKISHSISSLGGTCTPLRRLINICCGWSIRCHLRA